MQNESENPAMSALILRLEALQGPLRLGLGALLAIVRDHGRYLRLDVPARTAALQAWNRPVWWPMLLGGTLVVAGIWFARRSLKVRERTNARGEVLSS